MPNRTQGRPPNGTPPPRRLIAAGLIRRRGDRTLTVRVTSAGVTGRITPTRTARTQYGDGEAA